MAAGRRCMAVPAAARLIDGKKAPEGFVRRRAIWSLLYLVAATLLVAVAWSLSTPEVRGRLVHAGACTLVLGAVHSGLAFVDRGRTIPGVMLGMAGLASGAPLVVAAAGRPIDRRAVAAGLVAMLYFATSLAYVRAVRGLWQGKRGPLRRCLVAHATVASSLAALVALSFVTPLLAAAFVPVYARTALGLHPPPANLRVLGWREVGVAALFAAIALLSFTRGTGPLPTP